MDKESSFKAKILKEIEAWHRDGLISDEQAKNLISRYSLPEIISERSPLAKIITILSIFGSILVGIGVILFFASNWRGIPKSLKLLIILSSIFITNLIGYTLGYVKETYTKTGRAIILLGAILFGAGIYLVAQIYHFPANYPGGVLFWTLGIMPIAYILQLNPILFLSCLLLILWNILRMTGLDQPNYFYLIFCGLVILLTYRNRSRRLVFINLLGLIIWFMSHLYFWNQIGNGSSNILLFLNLGILFYLLGRLHETHPNLNFFKTSYKGLGAFFILLNSYLLTHDFAYFGFGSSTRVGYLSSKIVIVNFLVAGLAIVALIWNISRQKEKSRLVRYESYGLFIIMFLSILCLVLPETITGYYHYKDVFLVYPLLFNIILFLEIIAVIVMGYLCREIYLVNLGILFFAIQILTLYFSTFWKILPRSLFFILGGLILLIGGGFLEKKRRGLIAKIKSGGSA